jgi:hypothetical protein
MTVGTPPLAGMEEGLVDANWLRGLAATQNEASIFGLAAPNANVQATATPIPSGFALVQVDSAVATGSVVLPFAASGTEIQIINNTAVQVNVFANAALNPLTGALDTINALANVAAFLAAANSIFAFACAKNGKWGAK